MKRKEEEKYLGSFKNKFKKNRQNMFNGKKKKKQNDKFTKHYEMMDELMRCDG